MVFFATKHRSNTRGNMNFWQLNKKRVLTFSILLMAASFFIIYCAASNRSDPYTFLSAIILSVFPLIILCLVSYLPAINSFRVIRRLTEDTTERSIVPLFDSGYTIGLRNEKSRWLFTTPCIHATISGLPVVIDLHHQAAATGLILRSCSPRCNARAASGYTVTAFRLPCTW